MRATAVMLLGLAACGSGVSVTNGLNAELRVTGATFFEGAPPASAATGPQVLQPQTKIGTIHFGQINFQLAGELSPNAAAVAYQLEGDIGYWTQGAMPNDDLSQPTNLSFSTLLSFSPAIQMPDSGALVLNLYAIDAQGNFGPTTPLDLQAVKGFPSGAALVVSLTWANETDLDLHVVDPDGGEIWSEKRTLYQQPPFGTTPPPGAGLKTFGYLDYDSNNQCSIDGRREENAVWQAGGIDGGVYPPPGEYTVRVDTWSLCGQPASQWDVKAYLRGQVIAESSGESVPSNTRPPHGAGAGLTVLTFTIAADGGYSGP